MGRGPLNDVEVKDNAEILVKYFFHILAIPFKNHYKARNTKPELN